MRMKVALFLVAMIVFFGIGMIVAAVNDYLSDPAETGVFPVASTIVREDGCPAQATNYFETQEVVYIIASGLSIPAGADVFGRLVDDDNTVEIDSVMITVDSDINAAQCVYFTFRNLQPGDYDAQFFVAGEPATETVSFEVR